LRILCSELSAGIVTFVTIVSHARAREHLRRRHERAKLALLFVGAQGGGRCHRDSSDKSDIVPHPCC